MACAKTGQPRSKRLVTTTTIETFEPFTDWTLGIGVDKARWVIKRKNVQVNGGAPTFNVKPAIQVALVRADNPNDSAVISGVGPYTGAGEDNTTEQNIASLTASKFFVRFGVAYKVAAGQYECVYNNMPLSGLAKASKSVPAAGYRATAAARLGLRPDDVAPVTPEGEVTKA